MADTWKTVKAEQVKAGETVRTQSGSVVIVSRVETVIHGHAQYARLHRGHARPLVQAAHDGGRRCRGPFFVAQARRSSGTS